MDSPFNFQILQLHSSLIGSRGTGALPAFHVQRCCSLSCIPFEMVHSSAHFVQLMVKLSSGFLLKTMALRPHIPLLLQGIFYITLTCCLEFIPFFAGGQLHLSVVLQILSQLLSVDPTSHHQQVSMVTSGTSVYFPAHFQARGVMFSL